MPRTTIVPWLYRRWLRALGTVLLLGLVAGPLLWGRDGVRAGTEAGLQVSPAAYDFGRVQRLGGLVHTTFTLHATPLEVKKYLGRLSGPLLDRIDLHVDVPLVPYRERG